MFDNVSALSRLLFGFFIRVNTINSVILYNNIINNSAIALITLDSRRVFYELFSSSNILLLIFVCIFTAPSDNPYEHLAKYLKIGDTPYKYYDITALGNGFGIFEILLNY